MEGTFTIEYMAVNGAVVRCTNCGDTYSVEHGVVPHCPNQCNDESDLSHVDDPVDDYTDHHHFNPIEQGQFDDDPSPYDGTYSEE
jgi:hypothetical protein